MTGRREKAPCRSASMTRAARASRPPCPVSPEAARRRSPSRTSRTVAVRRTREIEASSGRPARSRTRLSTDGRARRARAIAADGPPSALTQRCLDLLTHAGDDLLGLGTPRLRGPRGVSGLAPMTNGVLGEPGPELVEVGRREALATQGAGPVVGEGVDQTVPLGREPAGLADEIGETRGHAYSFTKSRTASRRLASNLSVDAHGKTGSLLRRPDVPRRYPCVRIFEFTCTRVWSPSGSRNRVKDTTASPSSWSPFTCPQSAYRLMGDTNSSVAMTPESRAMARRGRFWRARDRMSAFQVAS